VLKRLNKNQKNSFLGRLCAKLLGVFGWELILEPPANNKYVVIGAPHTSAWDFPLTLLYIQAAQLPCHWPSPQWCLKPPFRAITQSFGGRDFNHAEGLIPLVVKKFEDHSDYSVLLLPEGTKAFVPRWKTDFYSIALEANVTIALGFIDYRNKTIGIGQDFVPTGDIDKDLEFIQEFYQKINGKHHYRSTNPVKF
jgi:1-acyl-sn-glycerol-3-phosphate acyltransferase